MAANPKRNTYIYAWMAGGAVAVAAALFAYLALSSMTGSAVASQQREATAGTHALNSPHKQAAPPPTATVWEAGGCIAELPPLAVMQTTTGQWTENCYSAKDRAFSARYYTFVLPKGSEVDVTLTSATIDTALLILEGDSVTISGATLHESGGTGSRTSTLEVTLQAGSYTIEARPYTSGETGSFTMTVTATARAPGAPSLGAITAAGTSLAVSWTAPADTGTSEINAYHLRHIESAATSKSDANWSTDQIFRVGGSLPTSHTLTGLEPGTRYDVQVRALNSAGSGPWSATVVGTTQAAPVISGLGCTPVQAYTGESVSCSPSVSGGASTEYTYEWTATGASPQSGRDSSFSTSWDSEGTQVVSLEVCSSGVCSQRTQDISVADLTPRLAPGFLKAIDPISLGESVELEFRIARGSWVKGPGGITVSFPGLTAADNNSAASIYESSQGKVETVSYYSGRAQVDYYDSASTQLLHKQDGTTGRTGHLVVATDNNSWPPAFAPPERTLKLRVTPKETGEFQVLYRYWLCNGERTGDQGESYCDWKPGQVGAGKLDQHGWAVYEFTITAVESPIIDGLGCTPGTVNTGENVTCRPTFTGATPTTYSWTAGNALVGGTPWSGTGSRFTTSWSHAGSQRVALRACNVAGCADGEQFITVNQGDSTIVDTTADFPPDDSATTAGAKTLYTGQASAHSPSGHTPTDTIVWAKALPTLPIPTVQVSIFDEDGFAASAGPYVSTGTVVLSLPFGTWVEYSRIETEIYVGDAWVPYSTAMERHLVAMSRATSGSQSSVATTRGLRPVAGGPSLTAETQLAWSLHEFSSPSVDNLFKSSYSNCVSQVVVPWMAWASGTRGVRVSVPADLSDDDYASLATTFVVEEPGASNGKEPTLVQIHDLLDTGETAPSCRQP